MIDYNEDTIAVIIGDCAHSVYTCMCKGEHTYANDFPEGSTSLQEESKILNLEIECYSEEIGSEFMEHYHYCNGNELADEERVFKVLYDDGFALVRKSNTGPNITTRYESSNKEKLELIKKEFDSLIIKYSKE